MTDTAREAAIERVRAYVEWREGCSVTPAPPTGEG